MEAGLTFNEKSERLGATPLFLAVWNKNQLLSEYLAAKEPKAISGYLDDTRMNILHIMTEDFYLFDRSILDLLV